MNISERIKSERGAFVVSARLSLEPWLDVPLPPTLCFSDTHLVPEPKPWSDDAPDDLAALIRALPHYQILSLGDLTESIGLSRSERALFETSPRLGPLFRLLAERRARLLVGNHDLPAVGVLERLFGPEQIALGGFDLGRVRVRHGHEGGARRAALEQMIGPYVVPLYERARRLARSDPGRLDNAPIVARMGSAASFLLFGHTHVPLLKGGAANPGCFLGSAQSFLTLAGVEVILWRREL